MAPDPNEIRARLSAREDDPPTLLGGLKNGTWLHEQKFPPLRYHIPGILPEGLTVLAGAPKVGKSWMVLDWLLAESAGGLALGTIGVPESYHVLYLALEDGDRRMQSRCHTLLGNEWRPDDPIPPLFEYMTKVIPAQLNETITEWLGLHPCGLVVVDTLGRVMPPAFAGETPYARDYRVMSALKEVTDSFPGAALLINHHDRKATVTDFVDSVSGTNGIAGGADSVIVLTRPRDEPGGLLQVTGRDVAEGSYAVSFHAGRWSLDGKDLDAAAEAARERRATAGLGDRSAEIVSYVMSQAVSVGAGDVGAALGMEADDAGRYLRRLADAGRLHRHSRGLYEGCPK